MKLAGLVSALDMVSGLCTVGVIKLKRTFVAVQLVQAVDKKKPHRGYLDPLIRFTEGDQPGTQLT